MSVLGKKPFVNKIIESLSTEQIVKLRGLIDNPTDLRTIALYGVDNLLSENDKGVHFVKCKLEELSLRIVQGFLCYADDDNCALFVFNNGSDIVEEYVIYPKVRKFERIYEYLNAEEFRRVLDDSEEEKDGGSVSLDYVNTQLNKKVNRVFNYQGDFLYGHYNGNEKVYEVQKQPGNNGIVQRTGNGNIVVPVTPAANDCATSKQYVDNAIEQAITGVLTEEF